MAHRIDSATAAPGDLWVERDPETSTPGTVSTAKWLNMLQEEAAALPESLGIPLDAADDGQLGFAVRTILRGLGYRNLFINPGFDFWRRFGTSKVITSAAYVADRWIADPSNGTATISRVLHSTYPSALIVHTPAMLDWDQTVAATGAANIGQRIEDVRTASGSPITGSIKAATLSGTVNLRAQLTQHFGAGGSANVVLSEVDLGNPTGSFALKRFEFDVPSVAGKVIGPGSYLQLRFFLVGSTFRIQLAEPHLELGSDALGVLERRPLHVERDLVDRYYEKSYEELTPPGTFVLPFGRAYGHHSRDLDDSDLFKSLARRFRVEKRSTPTITWYQPFTGTPGQVHFDSASWSVASTAGASPTSTGYPDVGSTLGGSGEEIASAHWTADAEL